MASSVIIPVSLQLPEVNKPSNSKREFQHLMKRQHNEKISPDAQGPQDLSLTRFESFTPGIIKKSMSDHMTSFHSEKMVTPKNNQTGFVIKVYLILSFQFLITIIFTAIGFYVPSMNSWVKDTLPAAIFCFISYFVIGFAIWPFSNWLRVTPVNIAVFVVFSCCKVYSLAFLCIYYEKISVLAAFVTIFSGLVFVLSYFYHKQKEYRVKHSIYFGIFGEIVGFSLSLSFCYKEYNEAIYGLIVVSVAVLYVIYDVLIISGGRFRYFSYDDYLLSAVAVHFDTVGLWFYFISIIIKSW